MIIYVLFHHLVHAVVFILVLLNESHVFNYRSNQYFAFVHLFVFCCFLIGQTYHPIIYFLYTPLNNFIDQGCKNKFFSAERLLYSHLLQNNPACFVFQLCLCTKFTQKAKDPTNFQQGTVYFLKTDGKIVCSVQRCKYCFFSRGASLSTSQFFSHSLTHIFARAKKPRVQAISPS